MAQEFKEPVHVLNGEEAVTIKLNGGTARVTIGAPPAPSASHTTPGLASGTIEHVLDLSPGATFELDPSDAGNLEILDADGRVVFRMRGATAELAVGHPANTGSISVRGDIRSDDSESRRVFDFGAASAVLRIGATGNEGDLILRDNAGREVIHADAGNAHVRVGKEGNDGSLSVLDGNGRNVLRFDSSYALLRLGAAGNEGDLILHDNADREAIHLDAGAAALRVGIAGNGGDVVVRDDADRDVFAFDSRYAVLRVGASGNEGDIIVRDNSGNESIHLNGGSGDIILRNADVAEDFETADVSQASPGTVMVVGDDGRLEACRAPYDRRVVGVVAGAGRYRPGIVLDRHGDRGSRVPISVMGKVACRADASFGPIEVGDLLTSSSTGGCAMRAADGTRAAGAVIGKALTPLPAGEGMVELLVALQ